MNNRKVKITGTGTYLPGKPVSFEEIDNYLGKFLNTPHKIVKWLNRTKNIMHELLEVDQYYFAIDPLTRKYTDDNISMSVKAAEKALQMAGFQKKDIEFIAYGSPHQDQMPTPSVMIQDILGIERCGEISIHANCTSAYKALLTAYELIKSGRYNNALVLSSNIPSSELRADYYNQKKIKKEELFLRYFLSDGAGAVLLENSTDKDDGIFLENVYMESAGGKKSPAMYNKRPAYWMNPRVEYEEGYHHLKQIFNEQLRKQFIEKDGSVFYKGLKRMIKQYDIDVNKIRFFQINFPSRHIAELIIEECESLGISKEKVYTKLSSLGYNGPPMAFICLDKILREEKLEKNDLILSFVTEVSKFMQAGFTAGKR